MVEIFIIIAEFFTDSACNYIRSRADTTLIQLTILFVSRRQLSDFQYMVLIIFFFLFLLVILVCNFLLLLIDFLGLFILNATRDEACENLQWVSLVSQSEGALEFKLVSFFILFVFLTI